eukprot:CAMPEP_0181168136 /NCGR_PEP_ID=MMETSP1096-20121128/101_1 /TAXON_ID=156174 ORGANISM="Chrysochromulina ericina, Strain CCMP281" /NCGR_SAMPLE_ID=MMETSP1096 /ASSEMBLY_ACC=CAM_ASM_000453 /LENGTH=52 /DNA_ID=CAMNT_0023255469 /DNA_START=518 /DNA_END=676 /DNA_ORIENTATION=+
MPSDLLTDAPALLLAQVVENHLTKWLPDPSKSLRSKPSSIGMLSATSSSTPL